MTEKRCLIPDCTKTPIGRGLCNRHYYAAKRNGTLDEIAPKVLGNCEHCENPIPRTRRFGSTFCSTECKEAARAARTAAAIERKKLGRVCVQCFKVIPPTRNNKALTCSAECNVRYQNTKKRTERADGRGERPPCAQCGDPIPDDLRWDARYCSDRCKKRAADARWRERAPGYMRHYLYGLTPEEHAALLEKQGNQCAICRTDAPGGKGNWHVDHCHTTKKVRGLLCHSCNIMLGHAKDNPELLQAAARYLTR